jgi:hypothetical protein
MLTQKGFDNILDILNGRCELEVTQQFIIDNYVKFADSWPDVDDIEHVRDFPEATEAWWTFDYECNSGGIDDTCQREQLIDVASHILFDCSWPRFGDSAEVQEAFEKKLEDRRSSK